MRTVTKPSFIRGVATIEDDISSILQGEKEAIGWIFRFGIDVGLFCLLFKKLKGSFLCPLDS